MEASGEEEADRQGDRRAVGSTLERPQAAQARKAHDQEDDDQDTEDQHRASLHLHGDLRRALLEVALDLIETQGPDAFTLREVARRAGVSHAAPYRHFPDKAALLAAVAEEGFAALGQATGRRTEPTARDRLVAGGVAYVRFALEHPAHFRVMFARAPDKTAHEGLRAASRRAFEGLVAAVVACQAEGSVRPGDPRDLARVAWALVHGLAELAIDGQFAVDGKAGIERLTALATGTLVEGLAPR